MADLPAPEPSDQVGLSEDAIETEWLTTADGRRVWRIVVDQEVEEVQLLLARVVDEHRISPSSHTCRCGWEAVAFGPPMAGQYVGHVTREQTLALAAAGVLLDRPADPDGSRSTPSLNHETTGGH